MFLPHFKNEKNEDIAILEVVVVTCRRPMSQKMRFGSEIVILNNQFLPQFTIAFMNRVILKILLKNPCFLTKYLGTY